MKSNTVPFAPQAEAELDPPKSPTAEETTAGVIQAARGAVPQFRPIAALAAVNFVSMVQGALQGVGEAQMIVHAAEAIHARAAKADKHEAQRGIDAARARQLHARTTLENLCKAFNDFSMAARGMTDYGGVVYDFQNEMAQRDAEPVIVSRVAREIIGLSETASLPADADSLLKTLSPEQLAAIATHIRRLHGLDSSPQACCPTGSLSPQGCASVAAALDAVPTAPESDTAPPPVVAQQAGPFDEPPTGGDCGDMDA